MGIFDGIPGVGKYIAIFESIAKSLKRIAEDTGIKDRYLKTGIVAGHLTLYENYEFDFRFRNTAISESIPAEIVSSKEVNDAD